MSIVLAGLLITMSGISVVAVAIIGVIPDGYEKFELSLVAIGWVFIIFGMFVRWKGLKLEREMEERKKNSGTK